MTQQKVDIFSAVKHIRLYRPQCISNEVRFLTFFWIYSFCFILGLCYLTVRITEAFGLPQLSLFCNVHSVMLLLCSPTVN